MWNISAKIMSAAKVRTTINHGGFRIYRHRLATALLGNGIAPPIISGILGQAAPKSLEIYLSADFQHLKNCALSIEPLPAAGEVSINA
jgi:site-specific recombinase XerD